MTFANNKDIIFDQYLTTNKISILLLLIHHRVYCLPYFIVKIAFTLKLFISNWDYGINPMPCKKTSPKDHKNLISENNYIINIY